MIRKIWTCGLLGLAVLASPAAAQSPAAAPAEQEFKPVIRSDTFNLNGALQMAARRLFAVESGVLLAFNRLYDIPSYQEAAEFEKYEVSSRAGGVLGTFTRMRVYPGEDSIVDLAVRLEDGRVTAVEPLRPATFGGKVFFDFPKMLLGLQEHEIATFAEPLSRLFLSLHFLAGSSTGKPTRPPPSPEKVKTLVDKIREQHLSMPIGDPMPPFSATDEKGTAISPESFTKKRGLFVMAMIHTPLSREVLGWVHRYMSGKGAQKKWALVEILADREEAVAQYRLRGGTFAGQVVLDPDRQLRNQFKAGFMPSVYVFDKNRKLAKLLEPPWKGYSELAAELDAMK